MTDDEKDLIADLLVRWEEAFEQGKDIPAAELCTECPQLTQTVRSKIESLKTTAWTKRDPARPLTDHQPSKDISGIVLADRYRLDSLLGSGGYGQVYKGQDLKLQRPVAVKIGHHRTSCDLLLDEARRVARLKHPGIVAVHDCGEHDGRMFLVFELVEGQSLADLVRKRKLSIRESVELVATIAESLHYAHEKGCFHRDIKPENILIDVDGKPLIADFGVACTLDELEKGRALSSGTLAYMSPEQVSNETQLLDGRCDVHALGVVLFELLSGASPFPAKDKQELREQILFRQPKRLREVDPSLPETLDTICTKALSKHPGDRHQTALELANELRAWLSTSKPDRRRWLWAIFGLVAVVALVAGFILSTRQSDHELVRDGVLHFDGRTRIVTNVELTLPVTLEAWIKPDPYRDENCQFIIGSDIPGEYGLGIAICGSMLSLEYIEGMVNSTAAVPPNHWSHVAAVFSEDDTRLYLNGKLVETAPGSKPGGKTPFVIGNVGQDNLISFYRGQIRSVRVSTGERYTGEFEPGELEFDERLLLIVDDRVTIRDNQIVNAAGQVVGRIERY
ncbi:protein kinase domain-containing protein [Rubinisphaera italica]|uniref:Serine/threonine-protein kinase PknB n=1 Tax=Rubinisphaera italica TaxID=2527969 RepID=A0A5C5XN73_9PLAN|nr:protein kinase [Rubinisphaera italica]TWT64344.1 Serine/threonine-protein kinase PknB [Rubinisphaera italica]